MCPGPQRLPNATCGSGHSYELCISVFVARLKPLASFFADRAAVPLSRSLNVSFEVRAEIKPQKIILPGQALSGTVVSHQLKRSIQYKTLHAVEIHERAILSVLRGVAGRPIRVHPCPHRNAARGSAFVISILYMIRRFYDQTL